MRIFERSGLLINCDSSAMELMLRTFFLFWGRKWNLRGTKSQCLAVFTRGPPGDPGMAFGSNGPLFVGVVFFPSSPFMGVVLFPSPVR